MFEAGMVVTVIIAIGQFTKLYVDSKYIPIVTMILGIIAGLLYLPAETIQAGIFHGVVVGLSANGLFDVTKTLHK
ncbi:hypothetical protein [Heliorestis convoluta]|uniref:Holin n=1 Tax=Heliorestis convoluta TaxID=356322 RepID=A0A5Q2N2Z4_9FIRM|nr:hypothetical protein [Heliorestis convoluta]QGG47662.1 Holin [Heliorestis convoluta]